MSCRDDVGGLVLIGATLLGLGIGLIVEHVLAGLLTGIGLGYIAKALLRGGCEDRCAEVAPRPPPHPEGG